MFIFHVVPFEESRWRGKAICMYTHIHSFPFYTYLLKTKILYNKQCLKEESLSPSLRPTELI